MRTKGQLILYFILFSQRGGGGCTRAGKFERVEGRSASMIG